MARRIEECITQIAGRIGRDERLTEGTRNALEGAIRDIVDYNQHLSPEQIKAKALNTANEFRQDLHQARVVKAKEAEAAVRIAEEINKRPLGERGSYLRNWIENASDYISTTTYSVSKKIRAHESKVMGELGDVWRFITDKRVPWARDSSYGDSFFREMVGIDTGNAQAKALVQKYRKIVEPYIKAARESGVYMGYIDDWGPQTHSVSAIIKNKAVWQQFLRDNLDTRYHPDPDATAERLFRTLSTRHLDEPDMSTLSMSRKIHFRSPEAQVDYFYRFGDQNFSSALYHSTRALVRKSMLAQEVGPTINVVRNQAQQIARENLTAAADARAAGNKKQAQALESDARAAQRTEWVLDMAAGAFANPVNMTAANWMGATRQWMITQFLGFVATLIATQDSLISVFANRFHTGGFGRSLTEQIGNFASVIGNKEARAWAEEMGIWTHFLHAAATDRFATPFAASERMKGISGQAATSVQRLSGTYALERALRSATMMTISRSLGKNLQRGWRDIHPKYRKVLEANGFTQRSWDEFRAKAQLDETLGTVRMDNLNHREKDHLMSFLYREADLAVVYPDHYDRALLTLGGQAGTAPGELAATATQFWSWPIAFLRGPLRREIAMGGTGTVGFAAGMMAAGAFSTQAYAILKNEPTFEWDSPTLWARSAMRSGLLTPVGEVAMQSYLYDRVDIGPVGRQFDNVTSVIGRTGMDIISGQAENAARPLANAARDLSVPNLWWTEVSLTSRAMDHILWELDPQYMRDRERRWKREGRDF